MFLLLVNAGCDSKMITCIRTKVVDVGNQVRRWRFGD
jgi:hypothetical protein